MGEDIYASTDDVRRNMREIIDQVRLEGACVNVIRYGKPVAVIVSPEYLAELRAAIESPPDSEKGTP